MNQTLEWMLHSFFFFFLAMSCGKKKKCDGVGNESKPSNTFWGPHPDNLDVHNSAQENMKNMTHDLRSKGAHSDTTTHTVITVPGTRTYHCLIPAHPLHISLPHSWHSTWCSCNADVFLEDEICFSCILWLGKAHTWNLRLLTSCFSDDAICHYILKCRVCNNLICLCRVSLKVHCVLRSVSFCCRAVWASRKGRQIRCLPCEVPWISKNCEVAKINPQLE